MSEENSSSQSHITYTPKTESSAEEVSGTQDLQEEETFHPYRLLGVIAVVTVLLALVSYGIQVYVLPDYY